MGPRGDRIAAKAVQLGLVGADRLVGTSQRELIQLIFTPGFSTATEVSNVSADASSRHRTRWSARPGS